MLIPHSGNESVVISYGIVGAKVSIFFKLPKKMKENFQKIIKSILSDIRVEMAEEFDKNFERQAFFSEAWQRRKSPMRNQNRALTIRDKYSGFMNI